MGHTDDLAVLRRELDDHRRLLERQAKMLEEQATTIGELRARLASVEHAQPGHRSVSTSGAPAPTTLDQPDTSPSGPGEPVTDRRRLLRHAGVAAAGVVSGAAVLAQAGPAAAAQGSFDGNPGVVGTANPTTGVGVQGTAAGAGGKGVVGSSTATTGNGRGVEGTTASQTGTGVRGEATATTVDFPNAPIGVHGILRGTSGAAVRADATATTGPTIGVRAQTDSPASQAVNAFCSATSGVTKAVRAGANSTEAIVVEAAANATTGDTVGVRAVVISPSGTAVLAEGGRRGVVARASSPDSGVALELGVSRVPLFFSAPTSNPLTELPARAHASGEVAFDTSGDLWLCVGNGTPGAWRRISGSSTAGALVLLNTPVRVYDSRPGEQPLNSTKGPITGGATGATRVVDMTNNGSGVPAGATGALVTLTIVNTSANGGFLALFRNGAATPATSSINWFAANQVIATTTVTALDSTAKAAVFCPPTSSTNFFVDIIGFFQ